MLSGPLGDRIRKGLGAQAFSQLVQIVVRLIEVPVFLFVWSPTRYGEWLIVAAIPTYLAFADGGFATTSGREITMRLGGGDEPGALRVFQSSACLLAVIGLTIQLMVTLAVFLTPLLQWVAGPSYASTDVAWALVALCAYVLAGFLNGLYYGVFCSVHRYDTGTWINSAAVLADMMLAVVAAALWGTMTAAAAGMLLSRILLLILDFALLKRHAPWCRLGVRHASFREIRNLAAPAAGSLAIPVGLAGNISGMRILVGVVLGPASVPFFSAMRTIARTAQAPTLLVVRILEPELAIAFGQGRLNVVRGLLRRSGQIATWSGLVVTAGALALAKVIFPVWVHHRFTLDMPTFLMLLVASALNGIWYTALQVAYATNRTQAIAIPFVLVYGASCLGVAWLLMLAMGVSGAALSLLLAELAMCGIALPQAQRLSGESWRSLLGTMLRPPVAELLALVRQSTRRAGGAS